MQENTELNVIGPWASLSEGGTHYKKPLILLLLISMRLQPNFPAMVPLNLEKETMGQRSEELPGFQNKAKLLT